MVQLSRIYRLMVCNVSFDEMGFYYCQSPSVRIARLIGFFGFGHNLWSKNWSPRSRQNHRKKRPCLAKLIGFRPIKNAGPKSFFWGPSTAQYSGPKVAELATFFTEGVTGKCKHGQLPCHPPFSSLFVRWVGLRDRPKRSDSKTVDWDPSNAFFCLQFWSFLWSFRPAKLIAFWKNDHKCGVTVAIITKEIDNIH